MKILGVIPARFASTRFPGKPLADLGGKSMIQRVYGQVKKATLVNEVVVATDNAEIHQHVLAFGGKSCMTNELHPSGTDRCHEALMLQKESFDYVINVQGDEPFIHPDQIDLLANTLDGETQIATLVKRIKNSDELFNPNVVKAVFNINNQALYFSRSPIPHTRNIAESEWLENSSYHKHIGMYAYRSDVLGQLTKLPVSSLEKSESLEQLRWLENGFSITVKETDFETIGIDTPADLQKAIAYLKSSA